MTLLPVKQYYSQVDSGTVQALRMCFSSTCAMAVKYLNPAALQGSNADDDYLATVNKYGDSTEAAAQAAACKEYGVSARFKVIGSKSLLVNEINKGFPVAVGVLHHGRVTAPRGGGHWMLAIGESENFGTFHDPYGEMDVVNGGYVKVGNGGKAVNYTWKNWLPRWEVDGPGTGWHLTFRLLK